MDTQPTAETAAGSVRGAWLDGGVSVFRGIPYAAAPTGTRRFRPPEPPTPWSGVRDAVEFGPTAPKASYTPPLDVLLPEADIPGEDYLNLNVWTPDLAGSAPVMVFVHGGAFANGSGSAPGYDGAAFARDGVVLVTLNYRLGAEGFLYFAGGAESNAGTEASAGEENDDVAPNLGLLDQIAALHWVRDNITAFGGDPRCVTVFGESAGAMSIGALLAMPRAAGLFHRAILESGAAHHALDAGSATLITRRMAEILEIAPTRAAFAGVELGRLIEAQQRVRRDVVTDPNPARWGRAAVNVMAFEPVIDGAVLPRDPAEAAASGETHDVDILVGSNRDEFRLFTVPNGFFDVIGESVVRATATAYGVDPDTAIDLYREHYPAASFGEIHARLVTDWFYRIPAIRLAEAYARRRPGSAFTYEFAWQPPTFDGRLGACHAAELPFVFDALGEKGFEGLLGQNPPNHLAARMHAAWVAFATAGDPGWPAYDETRRTTMSFDLESASVDDPRPAERVLWEQTRR